MPTKTFTKLKAEKRARFLKAALLEFGDKDYALASISQITHKLGIAKGSVYQYFENKKDLFLYLVEYANHHKQQQLAPVFQENYPDFYTLFEKVYIAGTVFDLENPLYSQFLQNIARQGNIEGIGNLYQLTRKQSTLYFQKLLQKEQENGRMRRDVDTFRAAFFIVQLSAGIPDFLSLKYSDHLSTKEEKVREEIPELIRFLVDFMKNGLTE